jgi:GT2 family glycosyltransferase
LKLVDAAEADGKRVFGIPTPTISNDGLTWNVGLKMKDDELRCNLFNSVPPGWNRCDYLGGAFLAVHRCVLEAIKGDWFNRTPTKSEDFAFSERARNAGFSVWFNGDSQCDHIHSASLLEMLKKQ